MCGIAGFLGDLAADPTRTARVIQGMAYRGPDDQGYHEEQGVQLGMCRLSIVDTVGGGQPLYNEDRSVAMVCNGEIYNHNELRESLRGKGHVFRTGSDCETIVHLYEERGEDLLEELHGMLGLLLWDSRKKLLLAARDRVGIKPLYYHLGPDGAAFCSEFSGLASALDIDPDLSPRAMWSFLCFGFQALESQTMASRIRRLEPGEILSIKDGEAAIRRYWEPSYLTAESDRDCDIDEMRQLFLKVLESHLICEVPSALMLSGGLDSSCLAAYAKQLGHSPLVISAGYAGNYECDERQAARQTTKRLGFKMTEVELDSEDYLRSFEQLMEHCDEPVADIASVPQWQIYKRVKEMNIKVLHTGLGGDEIFFGYWPWNDLVESLLRGVCPRQFESDDVSGFYFHPSYRISREFLTAGLDPDIDAQCLGIDAEIAAMRRLEGLSAPDRVYHLLFATWLPNNCLHLADRLGMGNSIEIRVPLLDDRMVDFVQGLSAGARFQVGVGKPLLKRMMSEHFDQEFLNRPKRGFTPPPNCASTLIERHRDVILGGHLARNFFRPGWLETKWPDMKYSDLWFRILVFEKWLENLSARRKSDAARV